ncbi:jerky protein homolog [Nephila pilipes]|uniref:Jerky protein homolog n=1 Tax=Nephila pilipes TaxID=299642 RepID=A0A8X6NA87_NEPPI|nr:jerky protein homolog [Nephila pilipes]
MNDFNIGSSTIYDIKKQKEQIKKFASEAVIAKNMESRHTLKKPKLEILDSALYAWFNAKRSEGKTVTGPMITEKAKEFHRNLNVESTCVFSEGWLQKFKNRHGIRKLHAAGESKSANENATEEYKSYFSSLVGHWELTRSQVYNADETGLLWRCLPTSTLAGGDEKCAEGFKKNKHRLTILLCANASGDHQLTPFVIGKYKKPRALKGILNLPVHYDAQSNALMTAELFKDWFYHHFVPEVKENFKKHGMPEDSKALLLLDNCTAHPRTYDLVSGNIFVDYLPPNVTPLIQPMNQGVIQSVKCFYRKSFVQGILDSDCNIKDFQRQFNVKDAIFTIALAWNQMKEVTLQWCWHKVWPNDGDAAHDPHITSNGLEIRTMEESKPFFKFHTTTSDGELAISKPRLEQKKLAANSPP